MYNQFYGFQQPPFNITPDPRFLFFSDRHREAYNHILFGIRERKGFIQITGEVGAGKTTLCRALLEELGPNYVTALILNPCLNPHAAPAHHPHRAGAQAGARMRTARPAWRCSTTSSSSSSARATTWCC